jgi:alpha-tubulin suppressor-like RCC1 family protein
MSLRAFFSRLLRPALALVVLLALSSCLSSAGPEAPTITDQPKDRVAFVGQQAKFDFGVSGKPPLTFQWLRNGTAIAGATSATYVTDPVTAADDGAKFSVKVTNAQGTSTSNEATLTVKPGPTITAQPTAVSVNAGASASFSVTATGEQLQYQWLRDDQPIAGANAATYTITATTAADDGALITALVVNPGGVVASQSVTLTVTSNPSITLQPVSQTVVAGDPVFFGVSAKGGNLQFQWRRNGIDIAGATSSVLQLGLADVGDDNAEYSVVVRNSLGNVTSNAATLRVVSGSVAAVPVAAAQVALGKSGAATTSFTLVRRSNGTIASWGYNTDGQRGDGTIGAASDTIGSVTLPAGRTARQIAAGGSHALVLLDSGEVYAWGGNDSGQLGLGDLLFRSAPVKVNLPGLAVAVAAGKFHSVALLEDGRVFTWGANNLGQLGDGGRDPTTLPKASLIVSVAQIAAGNNHVVALRIDGSVWAWGANAVGQAGDGTLKTARVPTPTGLTQIQRVRAGGDVSIAVSLRRGLYLWGNNADGQLGLGAGAPTAAGVPVAVRRGVIDAAAGERSTIALGSEGLLAAAGANDAGSLGDGGTTARNTFGAVSVVSGAIAVDIGGLSFAAAIGAEGTTWTWGDNSAKQLGNSTLTPGGTPTPTAVPSFDAIP